MDTLVIFTDYDTIQRNQNDYKLSWVPLHEQLKKITINKCEKEFILVYDGISDFSGLIKLIPKNSNVFIIHHSLPNIKNLKKIRELLKKQLYNVKSIVKKMHTEEEYLKIQEIDACVKKDEKGNIYSFEKPNTLELNKIFDWYLDKLPSNSKLESALVFLHICLYKKPEEHNVNDLLKAFDNKAIISLIHKLPSMKDQNYITQLGMLRDKLLGLSKN